MRANDTIAAISTAIGESGIGIIRISGEQALEVASRVYRSRQGKTDLRNVPSHTIHYGFIYDGEEPIDEVLVSVMHAPRTFTAENTVEINCHGGVYAMRRVLDTVIRAGARPAEPGEFTKRAFLNGRIDLSQAEAVMDVIEAKNAYALSSSVSQLRGSVKEKIGGLREEILYHTARIESALDDPEHYSLEGYSDELAAENQRWMDELQRLLDTADNGRMIREGISTVILGKPNAGKSSLMNRLLGEERAIVTDIAGTTRDVIHETLQIGGITLNLADTAGIRQTEDLVEKIGVDRAMEYALGADLILFVVDGSRPLDEEDEQILRHIGQQKVIILLNKTDLTPGIGEQELKNWTREITGRDLPQLSVSMKEGSGITALEKMLEEMFYQGKISFNDEVMITNARQKYCMEEALRALRQVQESVMAGMPEDFYTIDLMAAYGALGEILGEQISEDLANEIFGKFCMGK